MVCLIQNLKCQILFQHLLQYLCKYHLFLHEQQGCLYPHNKVLHFQHILVLHNQFKINTLQFYLDLILINLNKQAYSLMFEFFSFLLQIHFLRKNLWCDNLVLILIISSLFCCYKFNISMFSHIIHSVSKSCIIHQLEKVFLKILFCLLSQLSIHIIIWFQLSFLIKSNHSMNFFQN